MGSHAETFLIRNNVGLDISIPQTAEDDFPYFSPSERAEIKQYYDDFGYVVIRKLIGDDLLDAANASFDKEILPSNRFIYRQATGSPEKHVLTSGGYMLNSLLNPQSIDPNHYSGFRNASCALYSSPQFQDAASVVLGGRGKIVQGMYFHGNPVTWPHQDSYYLDSEQIGSMTAAWIAAEDIRPGAGRFFIYPRSHKVALERHNLDINIGTNHDGYKRHVVDMIKSSNLECRAPALEKGDVLFWNALTIHGSLPTTQPDFSRRSYTAHLIRDTHRFLQYQTRPLSMKFDEVNGALIARPKDQAKIQNRAVMYFETTFPKVFSAIRKTAIRVALMKNDA